MIAIHIRRGDVILMLSFATWLGASREDLSRWLDAAAQAPGEAKR